MNFFKLREVMNEAVTVNVNCDTHEFFGGISESFCEFNLMMNESSLAIDTDIRMGNEILIEAVMSGSGQETLSLINESVFGSVIDKIKAFFRKIVEYIKGIINKIKLFINGMGTKTTSWHGKMKKAVEDAARNKDITRNFEWMGYDWNHGEIDNIKTKADAVAAIYIEVEEGGKKRKISIIDCKDYIVEGTQEMNHLIDLLNTTTAIDDSDSKNEALLEDDNGGFDTDAEMKKKLESYKDDVKAKLEISGDRDKYKEAISNLCRGGKETKPLKGIDSKYSKMLSFIADCTDNLGKIRDSYDTLKKKYENILSFLETEHHKDFDFVKDVPEKNRKVLNLLTSAYSKYITLVKDVVTYGQGVYNNLCALQLSLTQECAREYMKVLTKLAMSKPSKA